MSQIRLFTDEDVHGAVAVQLRAAGLDAVSTPEADRLGESDESQFAWAAKERRVLVTFDVTDFARLHYEWMSQGRRHGGLIVSRQRGVGDMLQRVAHLCRALSAEEMQNRLEYLSNW